MERLVVPVFTPDATAVVADLVGQSGIEVVGVAIDLGQPVPLDAVRQAALSAGASRCHAVDARDRVVQTTLWPALRVGALGASGAPLLTTLAMPIVAETVADVVRLEQASAVAVWADAPWDRQCLRALLRSLMPQLGLVGLAGADAWTSSTLWASVSHAAALPEGTPPAAGRAGMPAPPTPVALHVTFEHGLATQVNGVTMTAAEIVESVGVIARDHGVTPWIEDGSAPAGRWTIDAPAVRVLQHATEAAAARALDAPGVALRAVLADAYAEIVRDGTWFSPARTAIDAALGVLLADTMGDVAVHVVDGRIEGEA